MKLFKLLCFFGLSMYILHTTAETYYFDDVATHGNGSESDPFNDFSLLQLTLEAGDTLLVMPGEYYITEAIRFRNSGTETSPIVIMASDTSDRPIINNNSPNTQIFRIQANYQIYNGFILDGHYCEAQIISISSPDDNAGESVTIKNCIVKRTKRDGIILTHTNNTLIDGCEIYYCFNDDFASQTDAHGVVGRHVTNLIVQNCNIHHTSGDCFQVGSNHSPPHWDNVTVRNCKFWTSHLTQNEAEFLAGEKPGENAIDTKTDENADFNTYRPKITIENVEAFGFRNDPPDQVYITGRAAFNIKHNVEATIVNCILYDNEIAFRLRGEYTDGGGVAWGGAHATLINCVAYDNWYAIWLEANIEKAHFYNCTFDKKDSTYCVWNATSGEYKCDPADYFRTSSYQESGLEINNCVFVESLPNEVSDATTNIVALSTDFRNYDLHEYYPAEGAAMIDKGEDNIYAPLDISGFERTSGSFDAGAYEYRGPLDENPTPFTDSWPTNDHTIDTSRTFFVHLNPKTGNIAFEIPNSLFLNAEYFFVINSMGSKVMIFDRSSVVFNGNSISLDVSQLPRGVYFMKVLFDNGEKPAIMKFIRI